MHALLVSAVGGGYRLEEIECFVQAAQEHEVRQTGAAEGGEATVAAAVPSEAIVVNVHEDLESIIACALAARIRKGMSERSSQGASTAVRRNRARAAAAGQHASVPSARAGTGSTVASKAAVVSPPAPSLGANEIKARRSGLGTGGVDGKDEADTPNHGLLNAWASSPQVDKAASDRDAEGLLATERVHAASAALRLVFHRYILQHATLSEERVLADSAGGVVASEAVGTGEVADGPAHSRTSFSNPMLQPQREGNGGSASTVLQAGNTGRKPGDFELFDGERPLLTAATILALTFVWAGFLGVMLSLYLMSAEVWQESRGAGITLIVLSVCGAVMLGSAVAAVYYARWGDAAAALWLTAGSFVVQVTGGAVIGGLQLPFGYEAAIAVLGLQVLPAALCLGGYALVRCY